MADRGPGQPLPSEKADLTRLPGGAAHFLGRDQELAALDAAWDVGWRGEGDPAWLLNEAATRLRTLGRVADAVADARHPQRQADAARQGFAEVEAMQAERQPQNPLRYSLGGFRYCDLLLVPAERAQPASTQASRP